MAEREMVLDTYLLVANQQFQLAKLEGRAELVDPDFQPEPGIWRAEYDGTERWLVRLDESEELQQMSHFLDWLTSQIE